MSLEIIQYCSELSLLSYNNDNIIHNNNIYCNKDFLKNNFFYNSKNYMKLILYNYFFFNNFKYNNYGFFGLLNKIYVSNIKNNIINYKFYSQNMIKDQNLNLLRSKNITENNKFLMNGFLSNSYLNNIKEFVDSSLLKKKINGSSFHLSNLDSNLDVNEKDECITLQIVYDPNWSISSSSNEDESMINKRSNEPCNKNILSINSSLNENVFNLSNIWETNLRLLEKLHLELDKFIYSDNFSFSQINGNLDTREKRSIIFNKKKSQIIIIKDPVIGNNMIVSANIFFSNYKKNNLLSLSNINILVEDGSNFFVEDDEEISPNPLINYLQKIKKNHRSDDSLIFCFNILRLYNHINNENLSIYLNLFNHTSDIWDENPSIVDNIILRSYLNDTLSKEVTDDIINFNIYVCEHQYKKANELLNKYNSDTKINKKVNKDFLKIIFALGWNILNEDFDNVNSISDYSDSGSDYSGSDYSDSDSV